MSDFKAKMHQIRFTYSAPPGSLLREGSGREGREREERGKEREERGERKGK